MYPERLLNEPSKRTPWIILEPGRIFIMGRSIPENPGEFYRPVLDWIAAYLKSPGQKTVIEFGFEYINTTSTKWIYTILKDLSEMKELGKYATVSWYFEHGDEDMGELGFILRSLVDCPFVIVEVESMDRSRYSAILNKHS
jgi:hypothetical protein